MDYKERKYGVEDVSIIFGLKDRYCKGFDPRVSYQATKNTEKVLTASNKSHAIIVGKSYRLVQDMLEQGATEAELQRAVRYLWVCIDAVKHRLDYRRAHSDFGIRDLSNKYSFNGMVV